MIDSTVERRGFVAVALAAAWSFGIAVTACTPATADPPRDAGRTATGGNTPGASGGSTNPAGSGGSGGPGGTVGPGSGGSTGSGGSPTGSSGGTIGSAGSVGSGGSTAGNSGGAIGSVGSGGTVGSGGAVGSGAAGGGAVTGCNWVTAADGTEMFNLPADSRTVLFDGTNLNQWRSETGGPAQWRLIGDGTMEVVPLEPPTDMQTVMKFEDLCVHVEYMTPTYPSNVTGQDRGNSGVYLKSAYEMQILDSIGQPPAIDTCGAVYSIQPPLVVACNKELVWNTYEIEFKASLWTGTTKTKNAVFVNVALNGKVVQRNIDLNPAAGFTQAGNPDAPGPQPLMLQDHRNLVRFRNVWVHVPRY